MITFFLNQNKKNFFSHLYCLLLSLNLFLAYIKLVNFFEAQMVIPPLLGVPQIKIEVFNGYLDGLILFIINISLLIISRRYIRLPNLTSRITSLTSLISLFGIVFIILKPEGAILKSIELLASFLIHIVGLTLIFAPRDTSIKTILIPSLISYLSTIIISIQLVGLCHWLSKPWASVEPMSHGALVEYQLFMTPTFFTGIILTAFIFSWLWIPIVHKIWAKYLHTQINFENSEANRVNKNSHNEIYLLIVISILSLFVGCYPYFGMEEGMLIGVDTPRYFEGLEGVRESGPQVILGNGRELFTLSLWVLQQFMSSESVLRASVVLNTFLIFITTVLLMKGRGRNRRLMITTLSIFSITNVVGGTIGLLTNWFTLSFWYVTIALLLYFIEKESKLMLICAFIASIATMFSHIWTWGILMLIILFYEIYSILIKRIKFKELLYLMIFLGLNGIAGGIYYMSFSKETETIVSTSLRLSSNIFRLSLIFSYFPKIRHLTTLSPQYSNFLIPLLGIIGMIVIFKRKKAFDRLIISWVFICSLGVYASSISGENIWMPESHAWRFLYLIPFHIPAAEGIMAVMRKIRKHFPSINSTDRKTFLLSHGLLIIMAPIFSQLNFMSLLIIPFGLALTLRRSINKNAMIERDILMVIILALFNFTLRALTTGTVFQVT